MTAMSVGCCLAGIDTATGTVFPAVPYQRSLEKTRIVSTDTANGRIYNNGNISLYLDGVAAMDEGLMYSYRKIHEIRCLPKNWNGNGASEFSDRLLDSVMDIVGQLTHQPNIFPTARDSIQLEYENNIGDYLEFELFESGRLKMFYCGHDGVTATEDIPIDMIYEAVDRFYASTI